MCVCGVHARVFHRPVAGINTDTREASEADENRVAVYVPKHMHTRTEYAAQVLKRKRPNQNATTNSSTRHSSTQRKSISYYSRCYIRVEATRYGLVRCTAHATIHIEHVLIRILKLLGDFASEPIVHLFYYIQIYSIYIYEYSTLDDEYMY